MRNYKSLFIQISNAYYNIGLERAKIGDLSTASEYLKKSLRYSKYHMNARNLLGLIFYECGEYGEAFVQWIISTKLNNDTNKNVAFKYITIVDSNKNKMADAYESITIYNKALDEAKLEREDLAMQYLYQVVEKNPRFVQAYLLLALLQVQAKLYQKAGNSLVKLLKIDKYNDRALNLFEIVKQNTGKKELEENINKKVFSLRKMTTDDVVIPKEVVKLTTNQYIQALVVGFIIALCLFLFVILPFSKGSSLSNNREAIKFADKVDEQNKIISELETKNASLTEELNATANKLKAFEEKDANFTSQYTTLNKILTDFNEGNLAEAAELYVGLDKEAVVDETLIELLNSCKSAIEGVGASKICELGSESWNGGDIAKAEKCYQLAIQINPNEPEYLFLLGRLYQRNGRVEEGNALFDKIIGEFPASSYAKRAKEARGY